MFNARCLDCGHTYYDSNQDQPCPRCDSEQITTIGAGPSYQAAPAKQAAPPPKAKTALKGDRPGAIVQRETLARSRGAVERLSAWGILLISFAGTVAALHGGWSPLLAGPRAGAIIAGVLIQVGLTYVQWAYYHRRVLAWGSRLIDTILTALGYGALILAPLARFWEARGVDSTIAGQPGAVVMAWGVIVLISYGLAWYPESRLVD